MWNQANSWAEARRSNPKLNLWHVFLRVIEHDLSPDITASVSHLYFFLLLTLPPSSCCIHLRTCVCLRVCIVETGESIWVVYSKKPGQSTSALQSASLNAGLESKGWNAPSAQPDVTGHFHTPTLFNTLLFILHWTWVGHKHTVVLVVVVWAIHMEVFGRLISGGTFNKNNIPANILNRFLKWRTASVLKTCRNIV